MNIFRKIILIGILIGLLITVRYFEKYFYDPFLLFFKSDFQGKSLPNFEIFKLVFSIFLRYSINSIITLIIIYVWFSDKIVTQFCAIILAVLFVVLMVFYLYFILNNFPFGYLPCFYVRRFLIQPIFLLLLIPAIYYHKKTSEK